MDKLKLRGFVTPEDFEGTDAEKIQQAIKCAYEKDIRKVVLKEEYGLDKTVYIYEGMHLVFDGAKIQALTKDPLFVNYGFVGKDHQYCFQEDMFFIEGKRGASIKGDFFFYNAYRIVFEGMNIEGSLTFEYCRTVRIEHCEFNSADKAVSFARGVGEVIMQYNNIKSQGDAVEIDAGLEIGDMCVAKETATHDMIVKENIIVSPEFAFSFDANEENALFNIFLLENTVIEKTFILGKKRCGLNKKQFRDLTASGFYSNENSVSKILNDTYNCFFE